MLVEEVVALPIVLRTMSSSTRYLLCFRYCQETVRGLVTIEVKVQPNCEIPGDIGVRIMKEGLGTIALCARQALRGATWSRPSK